jgi:hypothetical protein
MPTWHPQTGDHMARVEAAFLNLNIRMFVTCCSHWNYSQPLPVLGWLSFIANAWKHLASRRISHVSEFLPTFGA